MNRLKKYFKEKRTAITGNGFVKFLTRVAKEMSDDDGTNMAAGVAYYAFLSLFPLVLGLIAILGWFLPSQVVQQQIFSFFENNFPGATDVLETNIRNIIDLRGTLGIIGLAGLVWSGSGALSSTGHAINRAWGVERELGFFLRKPRDIGLTIGLGLLFFASLAVSAAIALVEFDRFPVVGDWLVQVSLRILAFLFVYLLFLILYKAIPNTRTYWRDIWLGALITAILFEIGRYLFLLYLNGFANYAMVYGSIGSVIALLIWIYYSAVIIILGAELTAEYSRTRRGITSRPAVK